MLTSEMIRCSEDYEPDPLKYLVVIPSESFERLRSLGFSCCRRAGYHTHEGSGKLRPHVAIRLRAIKLAAPDGAASPVIGRAAFHLLDEPQGAVERLR